MLLKMLFQYKRLSALLITVLYSAFVLPITEAVFFDLSGLSPRARAYAGFLKVLFAIALYVVTYYAIHFAERIRQKDVFYISWLKHSLFYFAAMFVLFIVMYPGFWVWDEYFVLGDTQKYIVSSWQHIFTQIYYVLCLYVIPTAVGIVVIQITAISLIVGYVIARLKPLFSKRWVGNLLFVPLFFIPVLLNNVYPLRLPLYSYIELLFLCKFILLHLKKPVATPAQRYVSLIGFTVMLIILAFWRSEGVYFLLFIPYIAYKLGFLELLRTRTLRTTGVLGVATALVAGAGILTVLTNRPVYTLTASLNPLSVMLQSDIKGPRTERNLALINTAIDVQVLRQYPSYNEVPAYWQAPDKLLRPGLEAHIDDYNKGFAGLVAEYPALFAKARYKTFLAANSVDPRSQGVGIGAAYMDPKLTDDSQDLVLEQFFQYNIGMRPFNSELKAKVTRFLMMMDDKYQINAARKYVWNIIPVVLVMSVLVIWALVRRKFMWLVVFAAILLQPFLVFLTAPASYFMYYVPLYVNGYFFLTLLGLLYMDRRGYLGVIAKKLRSFRR